MGNRGSRSSGEQRDISHIDELNPSLLEAQYAVRGEIVLKAQEIEAELNMRGSGNGTGDNHSFESVVYCNVGNPLQFSQRPMSVVRQVLALMTLPEMLDDPDITSKFPTDVVERAKRYLAALPGNKLGAYTASQGALVFRQEICDGLLERDGFEVNPADIFMTDGATPGIHNLLKSYTQDTNDAWVVPVPQYPLYSAAIALYGGTLLPYYLDEDRNWGINLEELAKVITDAKNKGMRVRGIVVINPGNPSGQVLSREDQEGIIRLASREGCAVLADEVYQNNIWKEGMEWESFSKVMLQMQAKEDPAGCSPPLASFHSISKGFFGECGHRGGYYYLQNFDDNVKAQFVKLASISLCPNVDGQVCTAVMMRPPKAGEASHEAYFRERDDILQGLKKRAIIMVNGLRQLEGVTCNDSDGALYVYPRIRLPAAAHEAAAAKGKAADWLYCSELLTETGIVVVPGSGFKQAEGTLHFRTTILPPEKDMRTVSAKLSTFHSSFLAKYGGLTPEEASAGIAA